MISIDELELGYSDAENYKKPREKERYKKIFIPTESLSAICKSNTYYLIGDKGTGKTAYAVYFSNEPHLNNYGLTTFLRETEYQKFIQLKKKNELDLSSYQDVWEIIIYFLISQQIIKLEDKIINKYVYFGELNDAIKNSLSVPFSPEIITAISMIEESEKTASITQKIIKTEGKLGYTSKTSTSTVDQKYSSALYSLKNQYQNALKPIKLTKKHILFIDGIDAKTTTIPYDEYIECIKGLANAVWSVNNDFFSQFDNENSGLKVILLLRPDIYNYLNLPNANNKLHDNSVLLDWKTTYSLYRESYLFKVADNLLRYQQDSELNCGECWDYYFPYHLNKQTSKDESFIGFLQNSLFRPRDIITMLNNIKEIHLKTNADAGIFLSNDFNHPDFSRALSEYFLGEIREQMSFENNPKDFEYILLFFNILKGKSNFTYKEFFDAHYRLVQSSYDYIERLPKNWNEPNFFLQLLYDLNMIGYLEVGDNEQNFYFFCYRERSYFNPFPKIMPGGRYIVHPGMKKGLNIGRSFTLTNKNRNYSGC